MRIDMPKESWPSPEGTPGQEQHGFSLQEADRICRDAFLDAIEGISDIKYEIPHVTARMLKRAGYPLAEDDIDGTRMKTDRRHAFEAWFRRAGEDETVPAMGIDLAMEFHTDVEKGTVTFEMVPLGAVKEQLRLAEAEKALGDLSGKMTFEASAEVRKEIDRLLREQAREKEDREKGLELFRAFIKDHVDHDLTPQDYVRHAAALKYVPIPPIDRGIWRISPHENRWRFTWWIKEGEPRLLDVIEFSDTPKE